VLLNFWGLGLLIAEEAYGENMGILWNSGDFVWDFMGIFYGISWGFHGDFVWDFMGIFLWDFMGIFLWDFMVILSGI
jgi:hypothetical protein